MLPLHIEAIETNSSRASSKNIYLLFAFYIVLLVVEGTIFTVFHDLVMYVCSKKSAQLIIKLYQKYLIQLRMYWIDFQAFLMCFVDLLCT